MEDRLVQEAVRTILEAIYEPVFLDESHGFRQRRSCHIALNLVKKTWTGCKWLIEVDVRGFFDNIDHERLRNVGHQDECSGYHYNGSAIQRRLSFQQRENL